MHILTKLTTFVQFVEVHFSLVYLSTHESQKQQWNLKLKQTCFTLLKMMETLVI